MGLGFCVERRLEELECAEIRWKVVWWFLFVWGEGYGWGIVECRFRSIGGWVGCRGDG